MLLFLFNKTQFKSFSDIWSSSKFIEKTKRLSKILNSNLFHVWRLGSFLYLLSSRPADSRSHPRLMSELKETSQIFSLSNCQIHFEIFLSDPSPKVALPCQLVRHWVRALFDSRDPPLSYKLLPVLTAIFIQPRSDHSLRMSVTHSLTNSWTC